MWIPTLRKPPTLLPPHTPLVKGTGSATPEDSGPLGREGEMQGQAQGRLLANPPSALRKRWGGHGSILAPMPAVWGLGLGLLCSAGTSIPPAATACRRHPTAPLCCLPPSGS